MPIKQDETASQTQLQRLYSENLELRALLDQYRIVRVESLCADVHAGPTEHSVGAFYRVESDFSLLE